MCMYMQAIITISKNKTKKTPMNLKKSVNRHLKEF